MTSQRPNLRDVIYEGPLTWMLILLTKGDESTTTNLSINSGRIMAKRRPIRPPKLCPEIKTNLHYKKITPNP